MKNSKTMMSSKDTSCDNANEMNELWSVVAGSNNDVQLNDKETKTKAENPKKRKKEAKIEKSKPEEDYAAAVEKSLAIFELAFEDDIALNQQSKPCINKLQKLPLLIETLSKKKLQKTFIDHGVFTLLKNWLEPLPDGSLPNINIRQAILKILTDQFQFDVNEPFFKEQLKSSGLGKAIMFLSESDEETTSNKKLARDLVYKWSRGIYNISARMEDARASTVERIPKRLCIRMPVKKAPVAKQERDDLEREFEFYDFSSGHRKIAKSNLRSRAQIPESTPMTFVIAPQSKLVVNNKNNPDNVSHYEKIAKKLRQLKTMSRRAKQTVKFP